MSLLMAGGWNQMIFKVPSNPYHSMILWFYEIPGINWSPRILSEIWQLTDTEVCMCGVTAGAWKFCIQDCCCFEKYWPAEWCWGPASSRKYFMSVCTPQARLVHTDRRLLNEQLFGQYRWWCNWEKKKPKTKCKKTPYLVTESCQQQYSCRLL